MKVAVLGASDNPDRYSFQAVQLLEEKGHEVYPINPKLGQVLDIKVYKNLADLDQRIDTLSMYVNSQVSDGLLDDIVKLSPRRIIFNPGSENYKLIEKLSASGFEVLEACTLVMLRTGQF